MRFVVLLLTTLFASAHLAPVVRADCPFGQAWCNDDDPLFPTESQWEVVCSESPYCVGRQNGIAGEAYTAKLGYGDCGTEIVYVDEFSIQGLTPGTLVNCKVVVPLAGSYFMPSSLDSGHVAVYTSTERWPGGPGDALEFSPSEGAGHVSIAPSTRLEFPLSVTAGELFVVRVQIGIVALGAGEGSISTGLRFEDLPEGASVYGCKGFRQLPPVPARGASWGQVKSLYR